MNHQRTEIEQVQGELIEEFELFDDWVDRYQYIIDLGKNLPEFPQDWRTEGNRIHGCQSQVWLKTTVRGDRLDFQAISDSAIVSGLIAILMRVYAGQVASEIAVAETPAFIHAIGLDEHLSPTRSNGLSSMIQVIQAAARDCVHS
ncbi:MAG: SufE family protein [Gammaproteobacteria bacterium]|nr:MAG: SufE family protein [Gammaproteobacteria bacterium]